MNRLSARWGILIAIVAVVVLATCLSRQRGRPTTDARLGFDSGFDARKLAEMIARNPVDAPRSWMRVRGVPDQHGAVAARNETRLAFRELRRRGVRPFVLLSAARYPWPSGVRDLSGGKGTLPLDLRDAFARGEWLGERYGAEVDAWEIDNEPELIYVRDNPESYAAYLKAMYLGLKRGTLRRTIEDGRQWTGDGGARTEERKRRTAGRGGRTEHSEREENSRNLDLGTWHFPAAPRVVMAPMAFPPGPIFEALLDNDVLSYTDGFNFHYYGYEEDFPGVYRQFEAAVAEWNQRSAVSGQRLAGIRDYSLPATRYPLLARRKSLPIFISEYGYGLLSGPAAATTAGRVRQWEYFRALTGHMRALRIEGAMAFLLRPYLEDGAREFGLTVKQPADNAEQRVSIAQPLALSSQRLPLGSQQALRTFQSGRISFTAADFGASGIEPWMHDIGRKCGDWGATPALAWLLHQPPLPAPRAWDVVVHGPSSLVIDFVAGEGMRPSKNSRGHFLTGFAPHSFGRGTVYLYNFSRRAVKGTLRIDGHVAEPLLERVELAPGERHELRLDFAIEGTDFRARPWTARFESDDGAIPPSRFKSMVYPDPAGFSSRVVSDLQVGGAESAHNAQVLDTRPLAKGEAPLHAQGRWRVTKGLRVEEVAGSWRFTVIGFPDETMRPAVAELPLPDGFRFPRFGFFLADLRLAPREADAVQALAEPRSEPEFSGVDKETMGIYFRTAQGGLYATTMHFPVTSDWLRFSQIADNFFTVFYGRMHFPWRFLENVPVSLVLMFRPRFVPATFEVRDARIVELMRE